MEIMAFLDDLMDEFQYYIYIYMTRKRANDRRRLHTTSFASVEGDVKVRCNNTI